MNEYSTLLTDFRDIKRISTQDYILEKGYQCFRLELSDLDIKLEKRLNTLYVNNREYDLTKMIVLDVIYLLHDKYKVDITKYSEQPIDIVYLPGVYIADFSNVSFNITPITDTNFLINDIRYKTDIFLTEYELVDYKVYDDVGIRVDVQENDSKLIGEDLLGNNLMCTYKTMSVPIFLLPEYVVSNYNQLIKQDTGAYN